MIYTKETQELVNRLDRNVPMNFRIILDPYEKSSGIDICTYDWEIVDNVFEMNINLAQQDKVLLEHFLYSFDVDPIDMQKCYSSNLGWSMQCCECKWWEGIIKYKPVYHRVIGNDLIFFFEFDPEPCSIELCV